MKGAIRDDRKSIKKTYTINNDGEYREKISYVDNLFSKKGFIFEWNKNYLKLPFDRGLPDECTLVECGKFYRIISYIIGDNQLLGYRSNKIRPLTIEKMSEMFGCSDRQTRKFIKKMKDIKAFKEVTINDVKWYAVNPLYALRSKYLSTTAFLIFQEELLPVLPPWAIKKLMEETREITDKVEVKK